MVKQFWQSLTNVGQWRFVTFFMPEVEDRGALAARGQL
jgi:hypothetical protein